jgi:hypothetical protein
MSGIRDNSRPLKSFSAHDEENNWATVASQTVKLDMKAHEASDSFSEVIAAAKAVDGGTLLDFGSLGSITLTGVALSKLAADEFVFG